MATLYRRMKRVGDNPSVALMQITMPNEYLPGQIAMIDYSGNDPDWYDRKEGKENFFAGTRL